MTSTIKINKQVEKCFFSIILLFFPVKILPFIMASPRVYAHSNNNFSTGNFTARRTNAPSFTKKSVYVRKPCLMDSGIICKAPI
jgi:hypothetical protein